MADVIVKRIEELGYYQGEKSIPSIKFRYAGKELGVSAWGMNVLELAPGSANYPEHDHLADGQEEVYLVVRGSAKLVAGEVQREVEAGTLVRVGPAQKRKFIAGPNGATLLAIGATPGKAYGTK